MLVLSFLSWQKGSCQQTSLKRPNIIFIMADDHAYQAISAYGSTLIQTPNIDRIRREGVIFILHFLPFTSSFNIRHSIFAFAWSTISS
nr:sulfatase-like hydrolase/transferase [Niastella koreensis]